MPTLTLSQWIEIGIQQGWCGPSICYTHDGLPSTEEEESAWDNGDDPCIHILRLYPDKETKEGVEANHSPSNWRKQGPALL